MGDLVGRRSSVGDLVSRRKCEGDCVGVPVREAWCMRFSENRMYEEGVT